MNTTSAELSSEQVMNALKSILDPEFGVSIVELGMIYDVQVSAESVQVTMTLTTPHCPAGNVILEGVRSCAASLAGEREVQVDLTFSPEWTPDRMSKEACDQLGWHGEGNR